MRWRQIPLLLVLVFALLGADCGDRKFGLGHQYGVTLWPGCLRLTHGMDGEISARYRYGRVRAEIWGETFSRQSWMCPATPDPMLVYQKSTFTFRGRNVYLSKANGASDIDFLSDGVRVTYEVLGANGAAQPYWGVPEVYANDLVVTHEVESRFAYAGQTGTEIERSRRTVSLVDWEYDELLAPYQAQWERYQAVCYDLGLSPTSSCLRLMAACQEQLGLDWDACLDVGESLHCPNGVLWVHFLGNVYRVCKP